MKVDKLLSDIQLNDRALRDLLSNITEIEELLGPVFKGKDDQAYHLLMYKQAEARTMIDRAVEHEHWDLIKQGVLDTQDFLDILRKEDDEERQTAIQRFFSQK